MLFFLIFFQTNPVFFTEFLIDFLELFCRKRGYGKYVIMIMMIIEYVISFFFFFSFNSGYNLFITETIHDIQLHWGNIFHFSLSFPP